MVKKRRFDLGVCMWRGGITGVYELQEGDRITHAIEAAGGLTEAAGQVYLNQAAHLTDGQRIYVPSREEEQT
mgnify:CR=1 FL=1